MITTVVGAAADTTTLDPTETQDPWLPDYSLGIGVDAVTGQLRPSAVTPFTVADTSPLSATYRYSLAQNEIDLSDLMTDAVHDSYNIEGVTVTAGTSFLNAVAVNQLSVTLVAQVHVERAQESLADSYELAVTPGPGFRDSYGDYFVAGYRAASSLYVLYRCSFGTIAQLSAFTAALAAGLPEVLTVDGSTRFDQAAKDADASVDIYVSAQGVTSPIPAPPAGGAWSPATVVGTLLPWFETAQAPEPFEVYLMHYRLLDPRIPGTVPIAPKVFADLAVLYGRYWLCRSLYLTCPDFGRAGIEPAFTKLQSQVETQQATLAENPDLIATLTAQSQDVLDALRGVNNRYLLASQLPAAAATEPPAKLTISADQGTVRWSYGFAQSTMPGVDITTLTQLVEQEWIIGWREHVFTFANATKLLVGFDVSCNWVDGHGGSWSKISTQVIGETSAAVYVKSDYDRGYSWTVRWHFVEADLYPPIG